MRRAAEAAVRDMEKRGAVVREVSLPHLRESLEAATDISLAEALHVHEAAGYFPARAAEYGEEVRQRIEAGGKVPAHRYLAGFDVRKRLLAEFDAAFHESRRHCRAHGSRSRAAHRRRIRADRGRSNSACARPLSGMHRPANFTGLPAISVPCGFTRGAACPSVLQLIGRAFDEATLLRIAYSYERNARLGRAPSQSFRTV